MRHIVKLSFPFLLVAVIFSSGCINIDPQSIALTNPMIKQFLDEHPNAEITATHLSSAQTENYVDEIRTECGNPYFDAKEMYRININDPDTNLRSVVWVDWEGKIVECAIKYGTDTEVNSPPKPGCDSHTNATIIMSTGLIHAVLLRKRRNIANRVARTEYA